MNIHCYLSANTSPVGFVKRTVICVSTFFVHSPVHVDIFNAGSKGEPSRKDSSVNSETLR